MSLSSVQAPGEGEKSAGCVTCQQCRVPPTWLYVIQTFSTILAGVDAGGSNGAVRLKGEEDAKNVVARVTDLRERKKYTLYSGRWEAARTATNVSEAGGGHLRCVRGRTEVTFLGIYPPRASLPLSAPIYLRREAAIRQRPHLTSPFPSFSLSHRRRPPSCSRRNPLLSTLSPAHRPARPSCFCARAAHHSRWPPSHLLPALDCHDLRHPRVHYCGNLCPPPIDRNKVLREFCPQRGGMSIA